MRRWTALVLAVAMMVCASAFAEDLQKAPDFVMEGYDGDVTYRDWDTNLFFSRMQEMTGISFQFTQQTDSTRWTERKNELKAGTNLPDVLFKAELSTSEIRDLYQAGTIIDLSPYLEEYAPDLWKLLEEHPDWKQAITLDDGAIPALPCINTLQNNDVVWINSSWLKKLGLETPRTAEAFTEVLRAFKTRDPNGNYQKDEIPLSFIGMWELRFLGHAFGIIDNDYYLTVTGGKVVSSLTSPENRAFLAWLHELWEEELIDHNGFTSTDDLRKISDEKTTIPYGSFLSSSPLTFLPQTALDSFTVLEPLEYNGKQVYRDLFGDIVPGTFAVTSACKDPARLVAWVNYLYTSEGNRLALYGKEGEDYLWNEDGFWEWSADLETVANDTLPRSTISEGGAVPGWTDPAFQLKYTDEHTRSIVEQLQKIKQYSVLPYPTVTLSREDEARIAEIQRELSDYAEKTMARFVAGDIKLTDENWDLFCRTADEKGLQEMIAI